MRAQVAESVNRPPHRGRVASGAASVRLSNQNEKPTRSNTQEVFDHVGLLVNGPPGMTGLPFI
jgi:hypothetical protein